MTVSIADCPKTQSFYNWEPDQGINIDLIFLVIDIFVILLLLVGMESGFLQRHWKELKYKVKVSAHEAIDEVIGLYIKGIINIPVPPLLSSDCLRTTCSNIPTWIGTKTLRMRGGRLRRPLANRHPNPTPPSLSGT